VDLRAYLEAKEDETLVSMRERIRGELDDE
jgi:hypothetical protein